MRCIPEEPEFGEGQSAEKAVWEQLRRSLPDGVILAHSVQVRHGRAEHEIDLLVLWPGVGLAAIEVKGGRVSIENGQWHSSGKIGKHRIQSPIAQSQSSAHAFKEWIGDQLGTPLSSRFAYMVCLPYTPVPADWVMAGCPRSLVLDEQDLQHPAELIRRAIETEGNGASPLATSYAGRIAAKLVGTLNPDDGPRLGSREQEDLQDHLTQQQAVLLAATRDIRRIRFSGGAGSGKTWLAVEKARRLCRQGKRVGLFCYNKGLGQYLRNQVSGWRQAKPVFIGEFHEYVRSLGVPDGKGQAYFDEEMPRLLKEMAAGLPEQDRLDAVVVDEAQDFAPLWWEALLACLKDPSAGEVHAFMDDHQDVYRRWDEAAVGAVGAALGAVDLVPIRIDENLRNTRRIAETFGVFAGESFKARGNTGLPVRFVRCATDGALEVAGDCVDALIGEGWANNQIALLTTRSRHPEHQRHQEGGTIPEYWREFHANESEFYGHVLGFKGLERSVVVLCVNGFKELSRAPEQLYVGLSRARSLLVVVGDPELLAKAGGACLAAELERAEAWDPYLEPSPAADMVAG
ncbi:NERD domain-containing protein/DEAD/DEAH box helicase [Arthrobacter sp. I2-34]|uniref:NERD domain-containing protein/DEAD/DEAH box helicase n=1 Tax=Arthrobacter hankyongi TaxID=2904801 RepID=A0ABS9L2I8_9MICC|nr:NERD domain-containing protein/DEAD/DEAH box helicase [Arthrobacter hankyongi]MCG2620876.1 NERD domain-containing protein/DEAD/DEAH box helicase [Arthrobacter hankyongi]